MTVTINYHHEGSGPPLVLLHGVGHHWQIWRPVIELLSGEFEIFACDLPGFGASPPLPPGVPRNISAFADAFEGFFEQQGLRQPHVAGNSMGGGIVLELARRHAVRSATAFSPIGFATPLERDFAGLSLLMLDEVPARAASRAAAPAALARARRVVRPAVWLSLAPAGAGGDLFAARTSGTRRRTSARCAACATTCSPIPRSCAGRR